MKTVVIIPTYNEKESIIKLLKQVSLPTIVVDDNSPDGTGDVVLTYAKKNNNVHLLTRLVKVGLGAAYLAGMKEAFGKYKADCVIVMDADLSHNPKSIPMFVEKIEEGYDLVVGSRYIKGGSIPKNWPLRRKVLSVFGNKITSFFLGSNKLTDWTSGYRALKRNVFEKVARQLEDKTEFKGYTFNISFAYHTVVDGFQVGEVPIVFPDRKHGQSKLGLEYLYHTPVFLFKTRLSKLLKVYNSFQNS